MVGAAEFIKGVEKVLTVQGYQKMTEENQVSAARTPSRESATIVMVPTCGGSAEDEFVTVENTQTSVDLKLSENNSRDSSDTRSTWNPWREFNAEHNYTLLTNGAILLAKAYPTLVPEYLQPNSTVMKMAFSCIFRKCLSFR